MIIKGVSLCAQSARRGRPRPTGHPHPVGPDPARSAHSTFSRRRLLFLFLSLPHTAIRRISGRGEADHRTLLPHQHAQPPPQLPRHGPSRGRKTEGSRHDRHQAQHRRATPLRQPPPYRLATDIWINKFTSLAINEREICTVGSISNKFFDNISPS